jgi:(2Fe-2S) ferredoxin
MLRSFSSLQKAAGLSGKVRINKAGCLDQCEHGPTVVVYPEAVWYGHVQPEDAEEIVRSTWWAAGRWNGCGWRMSASTRRAARIEA